MPKTERTSRKIFLIFFGPPGSGKGTQAEKLAAKLKLPIFSPGAFFRREVRKGTALGRKIKPVLERGGLAGEKIVGELIDRFLNSTKVRAGAIFDGYPRTTAQMRFLWEEFVRLTGREDKVYAILVDVSGAEVKRRLANRRICQCGAVFHLIFKPPKQAGECDLCGHPLFVRSDDRPAVIAARLTLYRGHMRRIFEYFKKRGKLIKVNGGQSIEDVQKEIVGKLKEHNIL